MRGEGDKIIRDEMKRQNTYWTRTEQRAKMNYSIGGTENAHFFRRITGKWDKKESARKTERERGGGGEETRQIRHILIIAHSQWIREHWDECFFMTVMTKECGQNRELCSMSERWDKSITKNEKNSTFNISPICKSGDVDDDDKSKIISCTGATNIVLRQRRPPASNDLWTTSVRDETNIYCSWN